MISNYISQGLIKAKLKGYVLPVFASTLPDVFPAYVWLSTSFTVGAANLVHRSKGTWLVTLGEQVPAFQEVVCPWASGACRLEAVLFYSSLERSDLN